MYWYIDTLSTANMNKNYKELCKLFLSIEDKKEADLLLRDLFTPQELEEFSERWQIVQELNNGTPQRAIAQKLNVSISTITRGSTTLKYGSKGFSYFLTKLKKSSK